MFTLLKKRDLFELAHIVWEGVRHVLDADAMTILRAIAVARIGQLTVEHLNHSDMRALLISSAFWADKGFPEVHLGERFAASLLVSTVSSDALDDLKAPWPGFLIEVPPGLITLYNQQNGTYPSVLRVLVSCVKGEWCYIAMTGAEDVCIYRSLIPPSLLCSSSEDFEAAGGRLHDPDEVPITEHDERAFELVGRLIATVCLTMTMPDMTKPTGTGHRAKNPEQAAREGLYPRCFQVGKPVVLDFRDRVRDYLHGTRTGQKLEVQVCVAGHFKRQHYGEGNQQVKVIWREPYWRGPKDGPVLLRPHVVKDLP